MPKSQKDKVAELEARVEFLTKTIESLRTSDIPTSPIERSSAAASTQESLDPRFGETAEPAARSISIDNQLRQLDRLIALPLQRKLHQKYVIEMSSRFDLLPLPNPYDFDTFSLQKPLLLMAVMYAAADGILHFDQREQLGKILLGLIVPFAGSNTMKSLELVQALLITSLWYRLPTYHTKVTPRELIQLAVNVAVNIGIDATEETPFTDLSSTNQSVSGVDAWLALVAARMLSSSIFIFLRMNPPTHWSAHDDLALFMLESPADDQEKNRFVAQYGTSQMRSLFRHSC